MQKNTLFLCSNCDAQFPKWSGRCTECGAWGTVAEGIAKEKKRTATGSPTESVPLASFTGETAARISTGLSEVDQVLGGGIVPGSLILIGGEPGIGKSTILAQIALSLAQRGSSVLYCSGEESGQQVKMRLDRLTTTKAPDSLRFLGETAIDTLCASIASEKPTLAIIDSIQTMATRDVLSEAGSIAQVRACTVKCLEVAKTHNIPLIITGHVTKEGSVAGPKTLEHLVDTVLYLEGDNQHYFRLLKTVKNRFGSTNEIGVFEMTGTGLMEVKNPSRVFLGENEPHPGTVTAAIVEGSRAFLVHVQALTSKTYFGYPQRRAVGFDTNRLQLLIAVLSKRLGVNLGDQDIHINIAGGLKISEPALDLAICASILSAYKNKPLDPATIVFGEVGLSGEVRPVSHAEKRLKEAAKLGFTKAIMPKQKDSLEGIAIQKIKSLSELEI